MMMQLMQMPIPDDNDVDEQTCDVADIVEHDDDGVNEDDWHHDNDADGNGYCGDDDDDVDKPLARSYQLSPSYYGVCHINSKQFTTA